MRRITLVASMALAILLPVTATAKHDAVTHRMAPVAATAKRDPVTHHRHCAKLFTVKMAQRAARAAWWGTRTPTRHDWKVLLYIVRCQRNPEARHYVHWYYQHQASANAYRRMMAYDPAPFAGTVGDHWAINAKVVYCESGNGGSPPAVNLPPNSAGASGYYQMLVSTWLDNGGGAYAPEAYLAPKVAQDRIAWHLSSGGHNLQPWAASQFCWG